MQHGPSASSRVLSAANKSSSQVPRNEQGPSRPQIQGYPSGISKASLVSPTPSIEADDEGSSFGDLGIDMQPQTPASPDHESQYEGEDSRLTSYKELAGWYSYGWAAEVFAICAMGRAFFYRQASRAYLSQPRSYQSL